MSIPLAALFSLLAISATAPASAGRMATVVRGVGAGSDKAAVLTGHFLREQLAKDDRYEVIDLNKALGNQDRDKALRAFQNAEESVQKGRDAYDTLELDAAVEYLSAALVKYERFAAYVGDFKKIAEALMLLGATHILRGEEKLGAKRLEQAINVFPQVEPDPRVFNPSMRSQFQDSLSRLSARPPGVLSVTSNPSNSEVFIDGIFAGVTPLAIDHLSEGRHFLRLEKDGFRAWGKVVDVNGRAETSESAQLKPTTHFEEFDTLLEACIKKLAAPGDSAHGLTNESVDALGVLLGAEQVFLAEVRLDGEKVQVRANQYDLSSQRMVRAADHVFTYDARYEVYDQEIAAMLRADFNAALLPGGGNGLGKEHKKDKGKENSDAGLLHAGQSRCWADVDCETWRQAILGVGLGVGGLAAVTGATFWYFAKQDNSQWRGLPQTDPKAPSLRNSGRFFGAVGDVFVFGGLLVGVAAVITYTVWDPSPTAVDVMEHRASVHATPLPNGGLLQATLQF